jgi:iron uptake system EfeUOB component EfeO/EfeM
VTERGYVVLAKADGRQVDISNKLSFLSSGKALIGYHRLRQAHLDCVQIDYLDLVDAFKQSKDVKALDKRIAKLLN